MSEMELTNKLDLSQFLNMLLSGARRVISNETRLNEINLFPVSDHDTGSNLASTMRYFLAQNYHESNVTTLLKTVANDILTGAYGNSGVIFAAFFSGFADHEDTKESAYIELKDFIQRLQRGVKYAYQSVSEPVEGTILSVMTTWAQACEAQSKITESYIEVFSKSLPILSQAVKDTKNQLKILDKNKVVDAGALGFFEFISGMYDYLMHREPSVDDFNSISTENVVLSHTHECAPNYAYCTETIISIENTIELTTLKEELNKLGDSLVIANGLQCKKIHLHVNDPLEMTNVLKRYGNIQHQKVDAMKMQWELAHSNKQPIAIVTDSSADMPEAILKNHQIHVLPLSVKLGNNILLDRLTINLKVLNHGIYEEHLSASTSSPTPELVLRNLQYLSQHYEEIIVLSVSSHLSATYQTIQSAANKLKDTKIHVIDTRRNSAAHGLLLLQALRYVANGDNTTTIIQKINQAIDNTNIFVAIDNLQTMTKHGRAPKIVGKLFNWGHLKPIVTLNNQGKPAIGGIAIGKEMCWKMIAKRLKRLKESYNNYSVMITHSGNLALAEEFANFIKIHANVHIDHVSETSAIIALHAGKDCVAVAISKLYP